MHEPPELAWQLRTGRWQIVLDVLALLAFCLMLFVFRYGLWLTLFASLLTVAVYWLWYWKQDPVICLQKLPESDMTAAFPQWRLIYRSGNIRQVRWRSGSIRRSRLLVLRYSIWPWQGLVLRCRDFESVQHFKALQRVLYSEL
tara:strand:+ start:20902 stop:21330 length:429 start_codon:yes stop_codon:yes gene_type:complete